MQHVERYGEKLTFTGFEGKQMEKKRFILYSWGRGLVGIAGMSEVTRWCRTGSKMVYTTEP